MKRTCIEMLSEIFRAACAAGPCVPPDSSLSPGDYVSEACAFLPAATWRAHWAHTRSHAITSSQPHPLDVLLKLRRKAAQGQDIRLDVFCYYYKYQPRDPEDREGAQLCLQSWASDGFQF